MLSEMEIADLEVKVLMSADALGDLEHDKATEYLRLTQLAQIKSWDASMKVEAEYALQIRRAQADYEIDANALRRASR